MSKINGEWKRCKLEDLLPFFTSRVSMTALRNIHTHHGGREGGRGVSSKLNDGDSPTHSLTQHAASRRHGGERGWRALTAHVVSGMFCRRFCFCVAEGGREGREGWLPTREKLICFFSFPFLLRPRLSNFVGGGAECGKWRPAACVRVVVLGCLYKT